MQFGGASRWLAHPLRTQAAPVKGSRPVFHDFARKSLWLLDLHDVTNLLFIIADMEMGMGQQRLILAIGRIERALSRLEQLPERTAAVAGDPELSAKHERLKSETRAVIREIDDLLERSAG